MALKTAMLNPMNINTLPHIVQCFAYGYSAATTGMERRPALDSAFMEYLRNPAGRVFEASDRLAWLAGYDALEIYRTINDEAAGKVAGPEDMELLRGIQPSD
jgi:hypothetical protein